MVKLIPDAIEDAIIDFTIKWLPWVDNESEFWDFFWLSFKIAIFPGVLFIALIVIFMVWFERKTWGRMHDRRGPTHLGMFGLMQPIADVLKLVTKEAIVPRKAHRLMFRLVPPAGLVIALVGYSLLPFSEDWAIVDIDVSLVLLFAILTLVPVLGLLAGWASGSKYPMIGGFRFINQQISYEVPLLLSAVGPAILAGSLNLLEISEAQSSIWYVFVLPISFIVFITAGIAEVGKIPFDTEDADSEIVFGWRTEYGSVYFGLLMFLQYIEIVLFAGISVTLFLGGSHGLPLVPPVINFLAKLFIMIIVVIVVSSSLPRVRMDQLLSICWRILLPLTLLNLMAGMLIVAYYPEWVGAA